MAPPIAASLIPSAPSLIPTAPPPPVAPGAPSTTAPALATAPVINKPHGKKIHWNTMSNVENTVFDELNTSDTTLNIELDLNELKSKFIDAPSKPQKSIVSMNTIKTSKPVKISLIDSKRTYNVDIALSRFRSSHTDIIHKISTLDVSVDMIENLLYCIPTYDEHKLVNKYRGEFSELDNVSQWFTLCTRLSPHIHDQLDTLHYLYSLQSIQNELSEELSTVEQACKDLHHNKSIKYLFVIVLKFGNYINKKMIPHST